MFRVLIADDEPRIRNALVEIIDWESLGFEIFGTASDGMEAFEKFSSDSCDLLITDIRMPRLNGIELIHKIRSVNSDIRILILSGYEETDYLKKAIQYNVGSYLLKPIDPGELNSILKSISKNLGMEKNRDSFILESISTLKNNTFRRLINQNISESEINNKLEFLSLKYILEWKGYCLGMAQFYQFEDNEQSCYLPGELESSAAFRFLENKYSNGEKNNIQVFLDHSGHVIFLQEREEELSQEFYLIVRELERLFKIRIVVVLGRSVNKLTDLFLSYKDITGILQYGLVQNTSYILPYGSICEIKESGKRGILLNYEYLSKYLSNANSEGMKQYLNEIMYSYINSSVYLLSDLKNVVVNAIIGVISYIKQRQNISLDVIFLSLDFSINDITACRNIEELQNLLSCYCEKSCKYLNEILYNKYPRLVNEILRHIHKHFAEGISLKWISSEMKLTSSYLGQIFKKEIGQSFSEFVNTYRIEAAADYLRTTNLKVYEIAKKVGFHDTHYFLIVFKKYWNKSPSEYRKKE